MNELKQKVIAGGAVRIIAQGTTFVCRFGSMMVLSRLLTPNDFGLVTMVTAVVGVLNLFREFGLSTAAVQRVTVTQEQSATLFWVNLSVGFVLAAMALVFSPLIASFYHESRLQFVASVLAFGFLFNAAGVQHNALLERDMRFTTLALIDIVSLVTSSLIGISLAFSGFGYRSLALMTVTAPLVSTAGAWITTRWVPGRPRRGTGAGSMIRFGGTMTLNGLIVYLGYNLEKILLGRFWGPAAIGIYGRSFQLVSIPMENLNGAVGGVAFAALSRVQTQPEQFRRYFLRGYSLVLSLTIPAAVACALFAPDMVRVVLGEQWIDAVPILRLLTPTIVVLAVINPLGWVMLSLGLVGRSLRIGVVLTPIVIVGYLTGLSYGPKGVALGYSAMMCLWVFPHIAWCVKGTPISMKDVLLTIARPVFSSLAAGLVAAATLLAASGAVPIVRLALGCALLFGVHFTLLLFVMGEKAFYVNLFQDLTRRTVSRAGVKPAAL